MLKLNELFSTGCVLQRRSLIPVWGTTEPYCKLEFDFAGVRAWTTSNGMGAFSVRLPQCEAGGPFTLTVRNLTTGESLDVEDVLVGEVWLASGQSNMEFPLNASPKQLEEFKKNFVRDDIRMFSVPRNASCMRETNVRSYGTLEKDEAPQADEWAIVSHACWQKSTDKTFFRFSAVAAWFAKELRDIIGEVPVGIVHSSWGGTVVETWTSTEALLREPLTAAKTKEWLNRVYTEEVFGDLPAESEKIALAGRVASAANVFEKLCSPCPERGEDTAKWADADFDDGDWKAYTIPSSWRGAAEKIGDNGVAWIRKSFTIPASWEGKEATIHLGGIDKQDETFFNGTLVGKTGDRFDCEHWNTPREYKVPAELVKSGKATVAIRAYSFVYDGSTNGAAKDYFIECNGEKIELSGDAKARMEVDWGVVVIANRLWGPALSNTWGNLFDSMINPLIPFAIKGVIWYQGESNAENNAFENARYDVRLASMITDWRTRWGLGDFPFIQVCLASYWKKAPYEVFCPWALLRGTQYAVTRALPNVGVISALDVGDHVDIHPKDKHTVGRRLAKWAAKNVYGIGNDDGASPVPLALERLSANKLKIIFDKPIVLKDTAAETLFYAADNEGKYVPAAICGVEEKAITLERADAEFIDRVRYAWSQNPQDFLSLFGENGYPVDTFEIHC